MFWQAHVSAVILILKVKNVPKPNISSLLLSVSTMERFKYTEIYILMVSALKTVCKMELSDVQSCLLRQISLYTKYGW